MVSVADQIGRHTAAGRMTLFILMSVTQWEREAIGERTADTLAYLKAEGVPLGRPALGWRRTPATDPAAGRRRGGGTRGRRAHPAPASGGAFVRGHCPPTHRRGAPSQRGGHWLPNTVWRVWLRGASAPPWVGGGSEVGSLGDPIRLADRDEIRNGLPWGSGVS